MRKHLILFFWGLMLSQFSGGQTIYFNDGYNLNNGCEVSTSILVIPNGYLIATQVDSACNWARMGVLSIDSMGNKKWWKNYGTGLHSYSSGYNLISSNDGNYAINSNKDSGIVLWKFDSNGDTLWTRTWFDSIYNLSSMNIKLTRKNGFIIVGAVEVKKSGLNEVLIIKTDSAGKEQFFKVYNSSIDDYGFSIDTCNDGGYIIGGGTANSPQLIKIDSLGNVKWQKNYILGNGLACVTTLKEGGYAFITVVGSTNTEVGLFEVNDTGKQLRFKEYPPAGNSTGSNSIIELKDKGFIIGGQTADSASWDGSLLRIDSLGNELWYREYKKLNGSQSQNYFNCARPTLDGGFVASGFYIPAPPDTGTENVWVLKVDSNGCDSNGHCPTALGTQNISQVVAKVIVFPNPNNGIFTMQLQNINQKTEITLFNVIGQTVFKKQLDLINTTINIKVQSPGIYLYRVTSIEGEYISSGKIVVESN